MTVKPIHFLPNLTIDRARVPETISIKGNSPQHPYDVSLADMYEATPSLSIAAVYRRLRREVARADQVLARDFRMRTHFELPEIRDDEVVAVLSALLDPRSRPAVTLPSTGEALVAGRSFYDVFLGLKSPLPYPLSLASVSKLQHTLAWADANIKLQVEGLASYVKLPDHATRVLVEVALRMYCLLVKQDDYWLARFMNFNHSMFLQDRVVNIVFGDTIYWAPSVSLRGRTSNRIALEVLRQCSVSAPRDLATLAVFMGVFWTSSPDVQSEYQHQGDGVITDIGSELFAMRNHWAIDDVDRFLLDLSSTGDCSMVAILDDNGESVFDLALFQALLDSMPALDVTFIVNRLPISTNLSLGTLEEILRDPMFSSLRRHLRGGQARLCVVEHYLTSLEAAYLSPAARACLAAARLAYIKGVNFFETFQPLSLPRYYAFVVSSPTSAALSGCDDGQGVFARVPYGEPAYVYRTEADVETLVGRRSLWVGGHQ